MHPSQHAVTTPDKPAIIMTATGETLSYRQLDEGSNQIAHYFRKLGLRRGDVVAFWLENHPLYLVAAWAAERSGLYFVPVPTHLTTAEAGYILSDSGARVLLASYKVAHNKDLNAIRAGAPILEQVVSVGPVLDGFESLEDLVSGLPVTPVADESRGIHMTYSSGTTGRPKGVRLPLPEGPIIAESREEAMRYARFDATPRDIYLSPAPLYHTAPLVYCMGGHRVGETILIMDRFSPEGWLEAVERYRATWSQLVPTMFVRLLKMPPDRRRHHDLSSLRCLVHAAAPCPVPVKREMMDWVGPILFEYYGSSEGAGSTFIRPEEWLRKPGSVGRANWGIIHVCDDDGNEVPTGQAGQVYFEGPFTFTYHNDPGKTSDTRHARHPTWFAVGDIGFLDEDGYLFLTDRAAFMIVSGGVNIYPQEIENLLVTHPDVLDAAVIGVPNADFGEEVKAVVQPVSASVDKDVLESALIDFCRYNLSAVKCPRSIDIVDALPRGENGKLYKKELRSGYW